MIDNQKKWMNSAIEQAVIAYEQKEVPIGSVIVSEGKIIGRGYNKVESLKDPTAHAELIAITSASNTLGDWRLIDCDLYVTLEPCIMCSGAIVNARIKNIFFGAYDSKYGAVSSMYNLCNDTRLNHQSGVKGGILEKEATIHISNVVLIAGGKPTRIGYKYLEDGRKVKYAKKTGELID